MLAATWAKKLKRFLRHSSAAIASRSWMETLDDGYRADKYNGLHEEEAFLSIRRQLHRLIPPQRHATRTAFLESMGKDFYQRLEAKANEVCQHRISLFGNTYQFSPDIHWHRDPISGYEWPLIPSYRINFWIVAGQADIRAVWELSCFRHAVLLGQAYSLTSEELYAKEFVNQVRQWSNHNPLNRGANWNCTMIVAIRAVNLLWAYALFSDSPSLDKPFQRLLLNLLRLHGVFIYNNLENMAAVRGNHYLANLVGLQNLSAVLPVITEAKLWFDFAVVELKREVEVQVLPDGTNFEASIPYHRLVTEMLLHALIIPARLNDPETMGDSTLEPPVLSLKQRSMRLFGADLVHKVERMLEFTLYYTKPDGSAPQIGDNDSSRWVDLSSQGSAPNDHRHLLAVGGEFFDRDDFRNTGFPAREEAVWLLDKELQEVPDGKKTPGSRLFEYAGVCIMRNGNDYVASHCGPLGTAGKGTHSHNDSLGFELCLGGIPYIADPGTYTYLRHPDLRNLFRSTAYHSTMCISGFEQNDPTPEDLFRLIPKTRSSIIRWDSNDQEDVFQGQLTFWTSTNEELVHRREFHFSKIESCLTITDEISGSQFHELEWCFHIYPGIQIAVSENDILLRSRNNQTIRIAGALISIGKIKVCDAWFSPGYDQRVESKIIRISHSALLPYRTILILK